MTVVDTHAHVFPEISRAESRLLTGDDEGPWLRTGDGPDTGMMMAGAHEYRPVHRTLWDPQARVADLDRLGVDVQVLSSTPLMFGYGLEPERAADWCRMVNSRILHYSSYAPDRLAPLCQVPLQDTEAACAMVSEAVRQGFRGVHIGNHLGDRDLDHGALLELLTHCAAEDAAVLVHPWDLPSGPRYSRYMLGWLAGMAAETHLTILALILSGAFERLPASLRLAFAHGGGSFPYLLGRADNAWHRRDLVRADSPEPPSAYTGRFSVDSAVFDPGALRLLVDVMGAERVLLGSDHPFPLGEEEIGSLVRGSALTDEEKTAVLGGNAVRFFGLQHLVKEGAR
ncbi:amidohydrolase family protein [Streptomyces sp. VRA16 Mangrove soil]|uniref:amidohydrolase family protein n=1 Tax=Streptomyces sp. VRA16 Mangrove soil TaxID=2817434 RepID=UPI001A9E418D|nr:amidohydrolase family protein [Streptomyces sp. VRA16 Mangrove soil]MBO1331284.1 amidohydrolase [Streptomyces sp. VRA16 Mangrove soil]